MHWFVVNKPKTVNYVKKYRVWLLITFTCFGPTSANGSEHILSKIPNFNETVLKSTYFENVYFSDTANINSLNYWATITQCCIKFAQLTLFWWVIR